MEVRYTASARRALKKVPTADRTALMNKLDRYAAAGEGDVKKLVGRPLFRLRHGDWRAIFTLDDGILVVRVAHRGDAYR